MLKDQLAELKTAAEKVYICQMELNKFIGRSIKVRLKQDPEPFYFKIQGYAQNGESFLGIDQEGQRRLIFLDEIDEAGK